MQILVEYRGCLHPPPRNSRSNWTRFGSRSVPFLTHTSGQEGNLSNAARGADSVGPVSPDVEPEYEFPPRGAGECVKVVQEVVLRVR